MAWLTGRGYAEESVIDPHTGLKKIVSVKCKGTSEKAKQEAFKRLEKKIEELSDNRMKLSRAVALWLKECQRSVKPSTYRKYRITLDSVQKIIGDGYMDSITAGYIRKKLIESGEENRTLNGYLKTFKTFWLWAYRNDLVKSPEVADKLQSFQDTPKKERIQDKYLEPWELTKLLDAMKEERHRLVTELLALSGLRIGELAALNKTDISGKYIHVSKTYDANNKVVTSAKTYSSKRDIYIQEELRDCIVRVNDYCKRQEEIWGYTSMLFFPDIDGGYMEYYTYRKYLAENSLKAIGRKIVPHCLRHTHASILFAKGMDLSSVSDRLGHGDSKITKEIYLHKLEELKEKENRQLDSIHIVG